MRVLICAQAFPPLAKNAGGVAKRYLSLCRAFVDGLGWKVSLLTPVNVEKSGEDDVDRWLESDALRHIPARGVQLASADGKVVFWDVFSVYNTCSFLFAVMSGGYDVCIMDDVPFRLVAILLTRAMGVPSITTTHTDITHLATYKGLTAKLAWRLHLAAAKIVTVHASVSHVFADVLERRYGVKAPAIWPPILWSPVFRRPVDEFAELAGAERERWIAMLGFRPKAIFLSASRWSSEKRIHLLMHCIPDGCALVIVGDSTSEYADLIEESRSENILPLRKMLQAEELRTAYAACDVLVSASNFETLGNVVIEAWCSGVPVAVQPAQGHLEFVKDGENSFLVNFEDAAGARQKLGQIVEARCGKAVQPELDRLGERFRTQDFANEVREALVEPALAARRRWRSCPRRFLVEPPLRMSLFFLWLSLWFIFGIFTRIFYLISCNPRFRFLRGAGKVVEAESDPPRNGAGAGAPKEAWSITVHSPHSV
eukprot:CAMPEP_0178395528 /NCGR_PEP_ID=MMETSP0689_2-20121128/13265_1 /TAXON_ID=160604 /ORGANISM="Amphidinium massartii, Strain CS-259" /LENGTH=483 /DNA_ID=CAMNT_0020016185 /DNA_START=20 /DNA_END=1468 /DNA_ORIENTATION=+